MSDLALKNQLENKIKDNPQSLVFARLADIYLKEEKIDEAIQLCQEGLKGNPTYVTGHFILAKAFVQKNDLENAESALKKVLSHDRYYLSALKCLGDVMIKLGWENTAMTHFKDILKIDPLETTAQIALENLSDNISEAIELPPSELTEESEIIKKPPAADKSSKQDEEWINQIREVFPDELSEQTEPHESEEILDTQDNIIAHPALEEESDKTSEPVIEESVAGSESAVPDLINESEESIEKIESDKENVSPGEMNFGDFDITVETEEETPQSEEPHRETASETDAGFTDWDLEALSVDSDIPETLEPEETDIVPEEKPSDEPADHNDNDEEIVIEEDELVQVQPEELSSENDMVSAPTDGESPEEWNIDSIEPLNKNTLEGINESEASDQTEEQVSQEEMNGNHDTKTEEIHEEAFIEMFEDIDSVHEQSESEKEDNLELEIEIAEESEESIAQQTDSGDQVSVEPQPEQDMSETTEIPSAEPEEIKASASETKTPAESETTTEKPSDMKQKSPSPQDKKTQGNAGSPKILTPTLGEIYIAQEQYEKAMDIFKQLSEMHPNETKYKEKIKFLEEKLKDQNI